MPLESGDQLSPVKEERRESPSKRRSNTVQAQRIEWSNVVPNEADYASVAVQTDAE
jgi:hypothetical protein